MAARLVIRDDGVTSTATRPADLHCSRFSRDADPRRRESQFSPHEDAEDAREADVGDTTTTVTTTGGDDDDDDDRRRRTRRRQPAPREDPLPPHDSPPPTTTERARRSRGQRQRRCAASRRSAEGERARTTEVQTESVGAPPRVQKRASGAHKVARRGAQSAERRGTKRVARAACTSRVINAAPSR